ncbi:MAG: DUF4833 domain-containing protein [Bacteroidetes bacterium]|nr:MAG: DUF4833 domain-containing protein [Bacteroidota bacterium]
MTRLIFTVLLLGIMTFSAQGQGEAWRELTSLPDDFPRPGKTSKSLFYLQRNMNANTIMYDLNFGEDGKVDPKNPIDVYWMRYPKGQKPYRREINWTERKFAYGYHSKKAPDGDGFLVELVAYDDRKIHLRPNNRGGYDPYMLINGKNCLLTNLYVYADLSSWWPDVIHVDIYGKDPKTGATVHERFVN